MEVGTDSKNGASVASPSDTIKAFEAQTQGCKEQWIQQLQDTPDRFADIEQQIDQHYRLGGGQLLASVLAEVNKDPRMDEYVQKIREDAAGPRRSPEPRSPKVRLVCGLVLWISTLYCPPGRGRNADPSEQRIGLYPELAAFGFGKGCSPALQYKVARMLA